ncbi:MAG: glycosyltransferase [Acidimicrobiales bacterium]
MTEPPAAEGPVLDPSPHCGGNGTERRWVACLRRGGTVRLQDVLHPWSPDYGSASILVVDEDSTPRGWVNLEDLRGLTRAQVRKRILEHSNSAAREETGTLRDVAYDHRRSRTCAVVIATRERPGLLTRALRRVAQVTSDARIVVIDNAPKSGATAEVVAGFAARGVDVERIVEPAPGLSQARNAALRRLTEDVIAFVDDDTLPDRNWLTAIREPFDRPGNVRVVTGLVPPGELETPEQFQFERRVQWGESFDAQIYRMGTSAPPIAGFPYRAGAFGTGANFAVDRRYILTLGGFDPALGAGTRTRGGEDLDAFVRIILSGGAIASVPRSIVWHIHRSSPAALRMQVFGYGSGLSAYLMSAVLRDGVMPVARSTVAGAGHLFDMRTGGPKGGGSLKLHAIEAAGLAYGGIALGLERWHGRGSTPDLLRGGPG